MSANESDDLSPANNPDLSQVDVDRFIERFEALETEALQLESRIDNLEEPSLRELAGPRLDALLCSLDDTLRGLSDLKPGVRRASIYLATYRWKATDAIARHCETLGVS